MRLCFILLLFVTISASAQNDSDLLIAAHLDLIKNDYVTYFQKAQISMEANYFFSQKFTGTGGLEVWTRDGLSAVAGARYYPDRDAFLRARVLLGSMNDFSIGGGWAKPINETLRFETMADFYFSGTFAIRAGLALYIRQ